MVPGTGDNLSRWFRIALPTAEKEESRVLKGQGPSQNFVIFQVAKLNLNTEGKHILEMQDRKDEFWTLTSALLVLNSSQSYKSSFSGIPLCSSYLVPLTWNIQVVPNCPLYFCQTFMWRIGWQVFHSVVILRMVCFHVWMESVVHCPLPPISPCSLAWNLFFWSIVECQPIYNYSDHSFPSLFHCCAKHSRAKFLAKAFLLVVVWKWSYSALKCVNWTFMRKVLK